MRLTEHDETRAIARLPGLDIEIIHSPAARGEGERLSVTLQATPLLGGRIEAAGPIALWMLMLQAAWTPWLQISSAFWALPSPLPPRR
jgi:hypothetical protein